VSTAASEAVFTQAPRSNARRVLRRFLRNRAGMIGAVLVLAFVLIAILAPYLASYEPTRTNWLAVRKAPSEQFLFGTDDLGRDVLSRLVYGARASLLAGVVSVVIAFSIGVPIGMLSGYVGRWLDAAVMRVVDAVLAVPFLILAIALSAFLGPSLTNAMIAIGISAAPLFARLARGQTLVVKVEDYVEAARAIGAPHRIVLFRHIFPNVLPPLLVQATLSIATAVIAEAALSFLGLGQQAPAPSWGSMLNVARSFLAQAPWMAIYPGIAIFLTVLGFNLLGDGLHDALDPKDE
jgi:ABC-type dipeptide/oligopeptide/nickel transport system permease subunit